MLKMSADEIRESYLQFFESKNHLRLPSYSLVPVKDPTLLLIGAGMAPLKPYFKGESIPPRKRIATCQKCIRVGDIENVGRTARHHTFFEMLGNFSFGDYYKKETCQWGWEYLTQFLKIPAEKLYVTIHIDDDDAEDIWINHVGIPKEKLSRLEDNFWGPIGDTGPCGPCSELLVDQGEEFSCGSPDCKPGCDCDRYLEIWNLVFTGLYKNEKGEFENLPSQCIDTGLGFERLVCYMHGKKNDFETELFMPYINVLTEATGIKLGDNPKTDIALKIIADHCRALVFMACDGITPSNEGRGYVMRRLLRRAVRYAREIGFADNSLTLLIDPIVKTMGHIYPELKLKSEYAFTIIKTEEENFRKTLNQGIALLDNLLERLSHSENKALSGRDMFSLYDTYGFPLELTREIAEERGFSTDDKGFEKALEEQRNRAKAALEKKLGTLEGDLDLSSYRSQFLGYRQLICETEVTAVFIDGKPAEKVEAGVKAGVVFNETCFYGESGGQIGDKGSFSSANASGEIIDTRKTPAGVNLHIVKVKEGTLSTGDKVILSVDEFRRKAVMRHHSATHLLQSALRQVLGSHVSQMGSLVEEQKLRFDFSHHASLSADEIDQIEKLVNQAVLDNYAVNSEEMLLEQALKKGALAFFGEKYDRQVRIVEIGGISAELCGGTHVSRTGDIGCFKITGESAIGMGIRRIEAVCGMYALQRFQREEALLKESALIVKTDMENLPSTLNKLKDNYKSLEKELEKVKEKLLKMRAVKFMEMKRMEEGVNYIALELKEASRKDMLKMSDLLTDRMKSGIIVMGTIQEGKVPLIVKVTEDLVKQGLSAASIIKEIAPIVGGSGGGKPAMAQAGGKNPEKLNEAIDHASAVIKSQIEKMKVRS